MTEGGETFVVRIFAHACAASPSLAGAIESMGYMGGNRINIGSVIRDPS